MCLGHLHVDGVHEFKIKEQFIGYGAWTIEVHSLLQMKFYQDLMRWGCLLITE